MDGATVAMLERDWQYVWENIENANNNEEHRKATAPIDTTVDSLTERFKGTLSEDQVQVFNMLLDLRERTDWVVRVIAEDHYFKLGCLAGYGKLDQIPELISEYPKEKAQEIARILSENGGLEELFLGLDIDIP